jgi:hypothetical protein
VSAAVLDLQSDARAHLVEMPVHSRALAASGIATWRARMVNEYTSAEVFVALSAQLSRAGWEDAWVRECLGFAGEERRHGVLCGSVVVALGGRASAPLPERHPFPEHPHVSARAAALRNVISICCMSETVAVALIGAERLEMKAGPLRALLTRIYSDEVGHARFGWRVLERAMDSLEEADRLAVQRYLPVAFAHLEAHELAHLPERDAPTDGACLGLCSGREARGLFMDTVETVIRPGLARWFEC